MKKLLLYAILNLVFNTIFAQNLVPNGSFENLKVQPHELNTKFRPSAILEGWREVAMGEIGLIHPSSSHFSPQRSQHGSQTAQDGESYGWFKALGVQFGEYGDIKRYYFQTKLTETLQKGRKYTLSFYISLADNSSLAIENISAFMFEKPIVKVGDSPKSLYRSSQSSNGIHLDLLEMAALTKIKNKQGILKDAENWTLVEEEFIAKGNETFLVIGNFEMQARVNYETLAKKKEHWNWKDAYYFIDNVSLTAAVENNLITEKAPDSQVNTDLKELTEGKTVVMENVLFESTKHDLLPASFPTLDSLVNIMVENPSIKIVIEGHTDNVGDSLSNLKLSILRAESVRNYLVQHKIAVNRIAILGFGATFPLLPNSTSRGRRRNRRVSIKVK
ncbi:MAG: OmpA family protein [Cytophagales bacterium]|nr:MAG: OmpA family protein [Cytophagales bacterium]